jgi:glycosyltransferase involved in cell wall biosynthesis
MRILFVVQCYYPAWGGTERYIQRIAEELTARYADEVTVFTTNGYGVEGFSDPNARQMPVRTEVVGGVTIRRFAVLRRASWLLRLPQGAAYRLRLPYNDWLRTLYQGPVIPGLARAIRAHRGDVVAASSFPLWHMFVAQRAVHGCAIPCVLHGCVHPEDAWGFDRHMIFSSLRRAEAYIANTHFEAAWAVDHGALRERVAVVAPGVEAEPYASVAGEEAKEQLGLAKGPVVGFIGQLGGHKGVDTLLAAMLLVWAKRPETGLLIAGSRTGFARALEREVAALPEKFRRQTRICCDFEENAKAYLYGAIDLLASPSGYESFGITFLEAWASGKPVIACRRGAVPEVVRDGKDGILVEYRDAPQLAQAILLLLNRPDLARQMGDTGRSKVRSMYTWARAAQAYRQVLDQALQRTVGER